MDSPRPLGQDPAYGKLGREVMRFANHTRRLVKTIQKSRAVLDRASAWTEGAAPLDRRPESVALAMRAIDKFARIHRENRQALFGAYFAHHHLRTQAELSRELLRRNLNCTPSKRVTNCLELFAEAQRIRKEWVAALLEVSIAAACPELSASQYAAFNVGALTDHEDVDLAIVVSSVEARDQLSRGFATFSKTFLRYASKIQLFLSDQLAAGQAAGLIEEYEEIVDQPMAGVVTVMQLLHAQYLCGSRDIAKKLEERISNRFYAESGDPLAHEGFLRAAMAELKHYRSLERITERFSPKREIYIPSKLAIASARVIYGVRAPHPPDALLALETANPARKKTYRTLRAAFVQNEVLRALVFLYVLTTDEIDLYDAAMLGPSRRVAVLLGLGRSATKSAEAKLLAYYKELRARAMGSVYELAFDIQKHLKTVSTFRQLIERGKTLSEESGSNLAVRLISALRRFQRGVFWDEIVELLSSSHELVERFLHDLHALPRERRDALTSEMLRMMTGDASSLVELLIFLAHRESNDGLALGAALGPSSRLFFESMLALIGSDAAHLDAFVARLDDDTESEALFRFASAFPPAELARLADLIEGRDATTRGERVVRALRSVVILVHHHSNRTGRLGLRVLGRIPEFVHRLGDAERLKELSRDLATQASREPVPREQIELLGDSFDVEALSAALFAILDGTPPAHDEAYVEAFDRYVQDLFKACFRGVQSASTIFERFRPGSGIALYATGGFGRGEGFGADWDYVAVVADDDRGKKKFFGKVIQRLTAALTKRGIIPHNRFTSEFNAYVVSVPELVGYLLRRTPETFIDEAELIEARFMFGDGELRRSFATHVQPVVFEQNRDAFLDDILRELSERRTALPAGLNVKLGAGGLREIHLLWLAVGVFAGLGTSFRPRHLVELGRSHPELRGDLRFTVIANTELRRVRDLYRLVVADKEDPIDAALLVRIAEHLAPLRHAGARGDLAHEIDTLMRATRIRVDRMAAAIEARAR